MIGTRGVNISRCPSAAYGFLNLRSGRPSHEGGQHLVEKFRTSPKTQLLRTEGRLGRSLVTTLDMTTLSPTPRESRPPVTACMLLLTVIVEIQCDVHLVVRCHPKRESVTPLRRVAVPHFRVGGVQGFRRHIPNGAQGG